MPKRLRRSSNVVRPRHRERVSAPSSGRRRLRRRIRRRAPPTEPEAAGRSSVKLFFTCFTENKLIAFYSPLPSSSSPYPFIVNIFVVRRSFRRHRHRPIHSVADPCASPFSLFSIRTCADAGCFCRLPNSCDGCVTRNDSCPLLLVSFGVFRRVSRTILSVIVQGATTHKLDVVMRSSCNSFSILA